MSGLVSLLAYLAIVYLLHIRRLNITWKSIGFDFKNLGRQVWLGIKICFILDITGLIWDFSLVKLGLSSEHGPAGQLTAVSSSTELLFAFVFSAVLIGAFTEELFFRGFIFSYLKNKFGFLKGAVLSAVMFSVAHGISYNTPLLFFHGLIYAGAYNGNNLLLPIIIAHSLRNLTVLGYNYFGIILW
ncbi:MAG: type II CAAX endopeptidase family protein [Patescibacteria group bacterium]